MSDQLRHQIRTHALANSKDAGNRLDFTLLAVPDLPEFLKPTEVACRLTGQAKWSSGRCLRQNQPPHQ